MTLTLSWEPCHGIAEGTTSLLVGLHHEERNYLSLLAFDKNWANLIGHKSAMDKARTVAEVKIGSTVTTLYQRQNQNRSGFCALPFFSSCSLRLCSGHAW